MSGAVHEWLEIAGVVTLVPPIVAAVITLVCPKQRRAMPGGPARLFLAVWFESFVLGISAGIAATVVRVFVPPLFGYGGDASVLTAIAGMAVGVFGLWAAQWFPPISKLLSDHFTVRRSVSRAKNFRAA